MIDFETANLSQRHPIEVGLIVCDDELNILREYESKIQTIKSTKWDFKSESFHKISQGDLENAPTIFDVGLQLAGLFKMYESKVGVNHIVFHANGDFDFQIMNDLMIRSDCTQGLPLKMQKFSSLKRAKELNLFESYKLTEIAKVLEYEYSAHRALSDCYAMLELLKYMRKYE